jgi:hypothetical protein
MTFNIGNTNNPPFNNVDGNLVNKFNSHENTFTSKISPIGPHTVQSGGKISRKIINRISRKYKKRTKHYAKRRKSRIRSKYARSYSRHKRIRRGGTMEKRRISNIHRKINQPPAPITHTVNDGEEHMINELLNTARIGDFIEYVPNNQMGYVKYVIDVENGNRFLRVVADYDTLM